MPTDGVDYVEHVPLPLLTVGDLRDDPYNLIADPNFEMAAAGYNAWPVPSNDGLNVDAAGTVWTVQNNNAKVGLYCLKVANRAGGLAELPNANLVECRQGNKYQLKAYVKNVGGTAPTLGSAGLSVHFLESDGETEAGASQQVSLSGLQTTYGELRSGLITAPPGTCYLRVYVFTQGQTAGDWYFDQLMLVRALGAEQFGVIATLNGLRDPSFEDDAQEDRHWYNGVSDDLTAGCTYSATNPRSGAKSLRIASAANNLYLYNRALREVHPNESLFGYAWIVCTSNLGTSGVMRVGVEWLNSSQGLVSRSEVDTSGFVSGPPAAYTQLALSVTAPVGAAYGRFYVRVTGFTSGAFWYVDDCWLMDSLPAGALQGQTIFPGAVVTDEVVADLVQAGDVEVSGQTVYLSNGGGSINVEAPAGFAGSYTLTLPSSSPTGFLKATAGVLSAVATIGTTEITNDSVTNAKLANMATKTYKGRTSAGTGDPEDVPVATLKTDLALTKADVGLGSVDNTSDVNKPVSTATQTALNGKYGTVESDGTALTSRTTLNVVSRRAVVDDSGSKTRLRIDDVASMSFVQDDFIAGGTASGEVGALGWNYVANTLTKGNSVANHPGIVRLGTAAVIADLAYMTPSPSPTHTSLLANSGSEWCFIFKPVSAVADHDLRVGLTADASSATSNGVYLERLSTDTNYFVVVKNGATITRIDSGVAYSASVWVNLVIRRNPTSPFPFEFYIGNNAAITTAATLPTTLTTMFQLVAQAAVARLVDVDYFDQRIVGLNR